MKLLYNIISFEVTKINMSKFTTRDRDVETGDLLDAVHVCAEDDLAVVAEGGPLAVIGGVVVTRAPNAEEQARSDDSADRQAIKELAQKIKNGVGTPEVRIARCERVLVRLLRALR